MELFNDVAVVAQLVSKLSRSHQDRWHQDKTSTESLNDQRKTGEKFLGWLERQGAAAVSARLTHHALALSKPPPSAHPVQKCGVCGKGGHKTESCTGSEGKGKIGGLAKEQGETMEQDITGNAFAASGRTYLTGQGRGTPPRDEWRQKMGTEEGAKELRVAAEEKT